MRRSGSSQVLRFEKQEKRALRRDATLQRNEEALTEGTMEIERCPI